MDEFHERLIIHKEQMEILGKARAANIRQARLQELRDRGLKVEEDPNTGDILLEDAAGGTARITPEPNGVSITSGEGRTHRVEHDSQGRLLAITDPAGLRVSFEHDEKGRLVAIHRGQHRAYRMEFDDSNNLTAVHFPDNTATHFTYDDAEQLVAVTDRNGNRTHYEYSETGQPTQMVDPLGNKTLFEYDYWDGPSAILFPNGDRHEFEYDLQGRLCQIFENGNDHATFDVNEGAGTIDVEYTDGTRAHFVLTEGRVIEAANETCTVKLEYDDQGNILREETDGEVTTYLRNQVGALIGIVTPDGERLTFERDKEHRVRRIIDWSGESYEIGYELNGGLATIKYPNGSLTIQKTTPIGLSESLRVTSPRSIGNAITSCDWRYDECDRVKSMTRDGETREYQYDLEGRLLSVKTSELRFSEDFELDANGNRIKDQAGISQFNSLNQLVRRGTQTFKYDSRGNMTAGPCPNGEATYSYNGRDQLVAVETSAGQTRYAYDAFGRRVRKECNGKVTRYIWAGQQLLSEITTEGKKTTKRDFLMFPEKPFPLAMRVDREVYYLHLGRRAEPLCMTDTNGEIVWKADYSAFGKTRIEIEKVSQPWRLAGQYYDEETGLYYVLTRYYNPELGRYLTLDPLRVDGGSLNNFYTYCDGDPINRLDPTGEFIFCAIIVGFAIGAAIGAGIEAYRQHKTKGKIDDGWGVAKAALIGGAIGAIGGGVGAAVTAGIGATSVAGIAGAGALSGMAASAVEQCAEIALTGRSITAEEFITSVAIGGVIGIITAGFGGLFARRSMKGVTAAVKSGAKSVKFRKLRKVSRFLKDSNVPRKFRRQIIRAFDFERNIRVETVTKDLKVYRYYGGKADSRGHWLTPRILKDPVNGLALPPENTGEKVKQWIVPKGAKVIRGYTAKNFNRPGGAPQIYVPDKNVLKEVIQ